VARAFGEMLGKAQRYVNQVRADFQREVELADLKRLQEEARQAAASVESSIRQATSSVQEVAHEASAAVSGAGAPPPQAPVWSAGGWGSHRFRTRARPGPSLSDLTEAVEQLRGRGATPAAGRFGRNRYAPRSRVNRPRIYR
jgi:sec-independent protein translocase protein TatB